jgi:hypothetical protein
MSYLRLWKNYFLYSDSANKIPYRLSLQSQEIRNRYNYREKVGGIIDNKKLYVKDNQGRKPKKMFVISREILMR